MLPTFFFNFKNLTTLSFARAKKEQGCQIFLGATGKNIPNDNKNIPNDNKTYTK
jgi:hypothetical protein